MLTEEEYANEISLKGRNDKVDEEWNRAKGNGGKRDEVG